MILPLFLIGQTPKYERPEQNTIEAILWGHQTRARGPHAEIINKEQNQRRVNNANITLALNAR